MHDVSDNYSEAERENNVFLWNEFQGQKMPSVVNFRRLITSTSKVDLIRGYNYF